MMRARREMTLLEVSVAPLMSLTRLLSHLPLLASAALAVSCLGSWESMPPIASLVSEFPARRAALDTLRQMSNQDPHVNRIAPDFTKLDTDEDWPRPDSLLGISHARWDEYRRLFKRVGSESGLGRGADGRVYITIKAVGLLGGASEGYVGSPTPPAPLVTSLDSHPAGKGQRYRALAGGWYVFDGTD
jgi:hypothetical protein